MGFGIKKVTLSLYLKISVWKRGWVVSAPRARPGTVLLASLASGKKERSQLTQEPPPGPCHQPHLPAGEAASGQGTVVEWGPRWPSNHQTRQVFASVAKCVWGSGSCGRCGGRAGVGLCLSVLLGVGVTVRGRLKHSGRVTSSNTAGRQILFPQSNDYAGPTALVT